MIRYKRLLEAAKKALLAQQPPFEMDEAMIELQAAVKECEEQERLKPIAIGLAFGHAGLSPLIKGMIEHIHENPNIPDTTILIIDSGPRIETARELAEELKVIQLASPYEKPKKDKAKDTQYKYRQQQHNRKK